MIVEKISKFGTGESKYQEGKATLRNERIRTNHSSHASGSFISDGFKDSGGGVWDFIFANFSVQFFVLFWQFYQFLPRDQILFKIIVRMMLFFSGNVWGVQFLRIFRGWKCYFRKFSQLLKGAWKIYSEVGNRRKTRNRKIKNVTV